MAIFITAYLCLTTSSTLFLQTVVRNVDVDLFTRTYSHHKSLSWLCVFSMAHMFFAGYGG